MLYSNQLVDDSYKTQLLNSKLQSIKSIRLDTRIYFLFVNTEKKDSDLFEVYRIPTNVNGNLIINKGIDNRLPKIINLGKYPLYLFNKTEARSKICKLLVDRLDIEDG